jgi:hypothetical protein
LVVKASNCLRSPSLALAFEKDVVQ